jgi:hypothetical protein
LKSKFMSNFSFCFAVSFAMSSPGCGFSICSRRPLRSFAGHCHWFGEVQTKARAVAEVDELHCYDLVDDAGQFPAGLSAFELAGSFLKFGRPSGHCARACRRAKVTGGAGRGLNAR